MKSNRPFTETLKSLLDMEQISQRELGRRCVEENGWGSSRTIAQLAKGELQPSFGAMENIARALRISPATFAEYRLMAARNKLDPREVGLKRALKTLEVFERALA
jgi:transcriptional regulator with XRE-family HTH domain